YWDELTSIGAAISHVVLDAPVGFIDEGIQSALISSGTPIRDVIAGVRSGEIKPSATLKVSQDGNGIGYVLFATLAMILFGPALDSLVFLYLTAVTVSAACFIA